MKNKSNIVSRDKKGKTLMGVLLGSIKKVMGIEPDREIDKKTPSGSERIHGTLRLTKSNSATKQDTQDSATKSQPTVTYIPRDGNSKAVKERNKKRRRERNELRKKHKEKQNKRNRENERKRREENARKRREENQRSVSASHQPDQRQVNRTYPVAAPRTPKPRKLACHPDAALGEAFRIPSEEFLFAGIDPSWTMYEDDPNAELELIIGLDFGTTFSKVVIREPGSNRSWVVPLSTNVRNPYLLKSAVYLDDGIYELHPRGERHAGLKMPFLSNKANGDDSLHAVAFLALVINFSKQWMLNKNSRYLAGQRPFWVVNVGLPAKDFEQQRLIQKYIDLVWAALFLTLDMETPVSANRVKDAYERSASASRAQEDELRNANGLSVHRDTVNAYPEIMAQLYGFLRSKHWDVKKPEFMLVDVGGGTLDSTIFNVIKDQETGELAFSVFTSRVEPLGTLVLHQKRMEWILSQLNDDEASLRVAKFIKEDLTDIWLVPDHIEQYLQQADFGKSTADDDFLHALKQVLVTEQLLYVLKKVNPHFYRSKRPYPLVLVGGGSANWVYRQLLNSRPIYKGVQIQPLELPVPDNLTLKLAPDTYHRVSVAYGLAFENLGKILTPNKIEELEIDESEDPNSDWGSRFVSQDQV